MDELNDDAYDWMVLINDIGQYSLWLTINDVPAGWRAVGPSGSKAICLAYVEENWTDRYIGAKGQTRPEYPRGTL